MPGAVNILDTTAQRKLGIDKTPRVIDARYGEQFVLPFQYVTGTPPNDHGVDVTDWDISVVAARVVFDIDRSGRPNALVESGGLIIRELVIDKLKVEKENAELGICQLGVPFDSAKWNPAPGKTSTLPGVLAQVYRQSPENEAEVENFLIVYRHGVNGASNHPGALTLPIPGRPVLNKINVDTGEILPVPSSNLRDYAFKDGPRISTDNIDAAFQAMLADRSGSLTPEQIAALARVPEIVVDANPSQDTADKLIHRTGNQEMYTSKKVGGIVPADARFESYSDAAFVGNFPTRASLPPAENANLGTWAWVYGNFQAWRQIRNDSTGNSEWVDVEIDRIIGGVDYVGHYASDGLAIPHVNRIGDLYNNDTLNQLRRVTAYTPASGEPERWEQRQVLTEDDRVREAGIRRDGDEFNEFDVGTADAFAGIFMLHTQSNYAGLLVITAGFTTPTRTYIEGQRWYLAPHLNSEADLRLLSNPGGDTGGGGVDADARRAAAAANMKAEDAIRDAQAAGRTAAENDRRLDNSEFNNAARMSWNPGSYENVAALRGEFTAAFSNLNETLLASLASFRIIEFGNTTVVHQENVLLSNWQATVHGDINAQEATNIGDTGQEVAVFRAEFYSGRDIGGALLGRTPWVTVPISDRGELVPRADAVRANRAAVERAEARISSLERHGTAYNINMTPRGGDTKADIVGKYQFEPIDPEEVPPETVAIVVTVSNGLIGAQASAFPVAIIRNWSPGGGPREFEITQAQFDAGIDVISGISDHFVFEFRGYAAGVIAPDATPGQVSRSQAIGTELVDWYIGAHRAVDFTEEDQRLLDTLGIIYEAPATPTPIEASADNADKLLLRGARGARELYRVLVEHRVEVNVDLVPMTTALLRAVTGNQALTWGGSVQVNPGSAENTVIWNSQIHRFLIRMQLAGLTWEAFNMPHFLGRGFPNEESAKAVVTGNNQVVEFGGAVQVSRDYVRREIDEYHWDPLVDPFRPDTIQTPVDGGDAAGVATITLPENYRRFRSLSMGFWHASSNQILEAEFLVELLAVQSAARNVVVSGNPGAGGAVTMLWTPSARTLAPSGNQAAQTRILFAQLHQ